MGTILSNSLDFRDKVLLHRENNYFSYFNTFERNSYNSTDPFFYDLIDSNNYFTLSAEGMIGDTVINFSDARDKLEFNNASDVLFGENTTTFTIELWLKYSTQTEDNPPILYVSGDGFVIIQIFLTDEGKSIHFKTLVDNVSYEMNDLTYGDINLVDDNWHLFTFTLNKNIKKIYYDGILKSITSVAIDYLPIDRNCNVMIGDSYLTIDYFVGSLYIVRFYKKCLNSFEAKNNFDYDKYKYNI